MNLLLISSSNLHGHGFLDHAEPEIRSVLGGRRRVAFVPFALRDHAGYTARVAERLGRMGIEASGVENADHLHQAEAIFIGGGNTFRLLKSLYDRELLQIIRDRVRAGVPYIGSSAGSNVAAPTIKTTNDMPIMQPPSFEALKLVAFQINPHYQDPDPGSTHKGETREERIREFLEENDTPVVGLREGAMLRVQDSVTTLTGLASARIFMRNREPFDLAPGSIIEEYLGDSARI